MTRLGAYREEGDLPFQFRGLTNKARMFELGIAMVCLTARVSAPSEPHRIGLYLALQAPEDEHGVWLPLGVRMPLAEARELAEAILACLDSPEASAEPGEGDGHEKES